VSPYQKAIAAVVLNTAFSVEEQDYYCGQRNSGCKCPVALAIRRTLDTSSTVSVCAATIRIDSVWFATPKEVDAYIKAYDRGEPNCFLLDFRIKDVV